MLWIETSDCSPGALQSCKTDLDGFSDETTKLYLFDLVFNLKTVLFENLIRLFDYIDRSLAPVL